MATVMTLLRIATINKYCYNSKINETTTILLHYNFFLTSHLLEKLTKQFSLNLQNQNRQMKQPIGPVE